MAVERLAVEGAAKGETGSVLDHRVTDLLAAEEGAGDTVSEELRQESADTRSMKINDQ